MPMLVSPFVAIFKKEYILFLVSMEITQLSQETVMIWMRDLCTIMDNFW